jgi:hypothetical protein
MNGQVLEDIAVALRGSALRAERLRVTDYI